MSNVRGVTHIPGVLRIEGSSGGKTYTFDFPDTDPKGTLTFDAWVEACCGQVQAAVRSYVGAPEAATVRRVPLPAKFAPQADDSEVTR